MAYAVCHTSVSALRSAAKDKSEQLSQVLFGEVMTVIDRKKSKWVRVLTHTDATLGWIMEDHIAEINIEEFNSYTKDNRFNVELFHPVFASDNSFHIPFGSRLPGFDGLGFEMGGQRYTFSGRTIDANVKKIDGEWISKIASMFLHAPHLPGGRSSVGVDAASFVQLVYASAGIFIQRDYEETVRQGQLVDFVEESLVGDIALFEQKRGRVSHIGIILDDQRVIHVDGTVRIDHLDHYGIFNEETQKYSYRLRLIRRVLIEEEIVDDSIPSEGSLKPAKQMQMF